MECMTCCILSIWKLQCPAYAGAVLSCITLVCISKHIIVRRSTALPVRRRAVSRPHNVLAIIDNMPLLRRASSACIHTHNTCAMELHTSYGCVQFPADRRVTRAKTTPDPRQCCPCPIVILLCPSAPTALPCQRVAFHQRCFACA